MKSPLRTQVRSVFGSRSLSSIAACACLVTALPALAEDPDPLENPFHLTLGTFLVNSDTEVRLDGKLGTGTPVDFDKTFGDEGDQTRFRLDGSWRFAKRHKVRAMIFSTSRTDSREFDREIEWEDEVFPVGTKVKGEVDFAVYQVAYEYLFLRRETWELGASIGIHYTTFETKLSATVETPRRNGIGYALGRCRPQRTAARHRAARHLGPRSRPVARCDCAVLLAVDRRVQRQPSGLPHRRGLATEVVGRCRHRLQPLRG